MVSTKNSDWFFNKMSELAVDLGSGQAEVRTVMFRPFDGSDWEHYASRVFVPSNLESSGTAKSSRRIYPQIALLSKEIPLRNISSFADISTAIQAWDNFGTYSISKSVSFAGKIAFSFFGSRNNFSEFPVWTVNLGEHAGIVLSDQPLLHPDFPPYDDAVEAASDWLRDPYIRSNRYAIYACKLLITTSSAYFKDIYLDQGNALKVKIAPLLKKENLVLQLKATKANGTVETDNVPVAEEIALPLPHDVMAMSLYLVDEKGERHDSYSATPERSTWNGSVLTPPTQTSTRNMIMPSIANPIEAMRLFDELLRRFEALEYGTSSQEDFVTAIRLADRLRTSMGTVFGSESQHALAARMLQFRYPRAKARNAVNYFNGDKRRAIGVIEKILDELRVAYPDVVLPDTNATVIAPEIQNSLMEFNKDYPVLTKTAFIMMSFADTPAHNEISLAIKHTLGTLGMVGLRADDKEYHPDLYFNILTYVHGCSFGIAVFDSVTASSINPNVAFEVGYMLAINKRVCLLKDKTLANLQADLIGKLYVPFDPHRIASSIQGALAPWLARHIT